MSNYNWEQGEIVIPSKDYSKVRQTIIKAHNARQDAIYKAARSLVESLRAEGKGKRNFDFAKARQAKIERLYRPAAGAPGRSSGFTQDEVWQIERLTKLDDNGKPSKLPKKQDLDKHPISRGCSINIDDATITFIDKTRTVVWDVGENNRAVERANEHPIAILLWQTLNKINWTRGSGGKIVGNDEYNREDRYDGGGGNYVTREYRHKTKKEREAEAKARRQSYGYGGYGRTYPSYRRW